MLDLDDQWKEKGLVVRLRQPDDLSFLRSLFRSTRWDETVAAGMPPLAAAAFLDQQFQLQCRHYDQHYVLGGRRFVIAIGQEPVGRVELWDDNGAKPGPDLRLVDISLMPQWRGLGLGTALMRAVLALAAAEGRTVSLHVDKDGAAERLYRRLGFRRTADAGIRWRMDWRPAAPGKRQAKSAKGR